MEKQPLHFETYSRPVSPVEALRFAASRSKITNPAGHRVLKGILISIIVLSVLISMLIAFFAVSSLSDFLYMLLLFVVGPIAFIALIGFAVLKNAKRAIRLQRFAEANGFTFSANRTASAYQGVIFGIGSDPQYLTVVNGTYQGLPFEFGNFYCTVGSGKSSHKRGFGVIEVMLKRKLPHILLDSRANNHFGLSNLPLYKDNQHLSLEGNFNDYFNLYVPRGYERDALYLITPELMALLIDLGARFDIEIVDDRLYIYQDGDFNLQQQQVVEQIFRLITMLGAEVQENTARYADAAMGNRAANIVAEPGRRLKRAFSWVAAVIFILWTAFWIAESFGLL
jgi:hypothetical protein